MIWPYALTSAGYGNLTVDGRQQSPHVLACIAFHGPRPPGAEATHGPCHNRACWNPRHLSWKTRAENAGDRARDGSLLHGERNVQAKLTTAQVVEIRALYAAGRFTQADLARRYGVSRRAVGRVVDRTRWGHI